MHNISISAKKKLDDLDHNLSEVHEVVQEPRRAFFVFLLIKII